MGSLLYTKQGQGMLTLPNSSINASGILMYPHFKEEVVILWR